MPAGTSNLASELRRMAAALLELADQMEPPCPRMNPAWLQLKAEIISKFGKISTCAAELDCSDEAIRQTTRGRCPVLASRLRALLDSTPAA